MTCFRVWSKRVLEAEKQEARKQRLESAKIASAPAQGFQRLPVFSPPKKVSKIETTSNTYTPNVSESNILLSRDFIYAFVFPSFFFPTLI